MESYKGCQLGIRFTEGSKATIRSAGTPTPTLLTVSRRYRFMTLGFFHGSAVT